MSFGIDYVRQFLSGEFRVVYEQTRSEELVSFVLPFEGYSVVIDINNERDFICCRIPNITRVRKKHKAAVLEKAMDFNYQMIMGKYGLDSRGGELAFEVTQSTAGMKEPWEDHEPLLGRAISVVMQIGATEVTGFQEMNFTGKWPEESKEGSEPEDADEMHYRTLCVPVRKGMVSLADIPDEKLPEVLDLIITLSLKPGRDRIEDYPAEWQEPLRKQSGADPGSEI